MIKQVSWDASGVEYLAGVYADEFFIKLFLLNKKVRFLL